MYCHLLVTCDFFLIIIMKKIIFNTLFEQVLVAEGYQKNMFLDKKTLKSRLFNREEKKAFLPYSREEPIGETNLLPRQPRS
jgi:hypothetical protein